MKPGLSDRERQQIADDMIAELEKPIEGVPDFQNDEEAMDFAIEQVRRYREEKKALSRYPKKPISIFSSG